MKYFNAILTRSYTVNISADNIKSAKELAEFFIGDTRDVANEKEQNQYHFKIREIEMVLNEAWEAEEVEI